MKKKVVIVAGPTASGKSTYAIEYALANNGVIINGDSQQIYKALPLLTAVPSVEERQIVPHLLYQVLAAEETCSVAKWHDLVCTAIDQVHAQDKLPIVVGGTGLYLQTLTKGLAAIPDIPEDIRAQVRALSTEDAYEALKKADPDMVARLNINDSQRLKRAYEVILATGKSLKYWQGQNDVNRIESYQVEKIYLDRDKEELESRLRERFVAMLDQGVVEEVQAFLNSVENPQKVLLYKAVGVREIESYLKNEIDHAELIERVVISTRQYVKRQRTWFRKAFADAQKVIL